MIQEDVKQNELKFTTKINSLQRNNEHQESLLKENEYKLAQLSAQNKDLID